MVVRHGLRPDLVSVRRSAASLLEAFAGHDLRGRRILVWGGPETSRGPAEGLRGRGAVVDHVTAYGLEDEAPPPAVLERIDAGEVEAVVLISGSTTRALSRVLGPERLAMLLRQAFVASIGPMTTSELRRLGGTAGVEASETTMQGVVRALAERMPRRG